VRRRRYAGVDAAAEEEWSMSYTVQEYHAYFTEEALRQVAEGIKDISDDDLHFRLHATSNSIGWDAWHIFRTVDNLVHFAFDREQPVWLQQGLDQRWDLPRVDQGTAMSPEEAWAMRFPPADQLAQYGQDVVDAVLPRITSMSDDYLQVVTHVVPWGDRTRLWILGKVITHSSKHLGYIAGGLGVRGLQGPSF